MTQVADSWSSALAPRYTLGRLIGEGAAACVYAARDVKHDRDVAVKILRPELVQEVVSPRFLREIHIAAQLSHPHILPLFDSGDIDGIPYFVMPLVNGETLRNRLDREGALPVDVALGITRQVAAALEYAHAQGVVHRDIKPENILLDGREALVADFGIAVAFDPRVSAERITGAGVVVGTPRYMSPEQAAGDPRVDSRSDLYALGCVTYEMLTGRPPFDALDSRSVLVSHALAAPPSPRAQRREVPVAVDRAVRAIMAKDPADRLPTARAFIDALSTPLPRRSVPASRRSRLAWGIGAAVVAVALALGAWRATRERDGAAMTRRWVLVADIEAPPGEESLARTVRDLLVAGLVQSPVLAVVPSDQVAAARREASMPDSELLLPERAREIAARSAVQVIVTGRVSRVAPDAWAVMLQGTSAEDGHVLAAVPASAPAGGDALLAEVGRVVRTLSNALGAEVAHFAPDESPPHVATPSFAAFRKYSDATRVIRSGDYDATVALLREAVRLDTGFASAWAMMGLSYVGARQRDSARVAFGPARANVSRLTDAEAHRLRGDMAAAIDGDLEEAVRAYDRFLDLLPESVPGRANRALYLSSLGRDDEALAEFARAASIDPLGRGPGQLQLLNLAAEYVVVGRLDSARVHAARLRGSPAQYLQMLLLSATGSWDSLAVIATRYASAPSTERFVRLPAALHAAGARAARGDARSAEESLVAAMRTAAPADLRWLLHGRLLLDLGRSVRPTWSLPDALMRDTSSGTDLLEGVLRARRGDVAEASARLRALEARPDSGRRVVGQGLAVLRGEIALANGRADVASQWLEGPARRGEHDALSLDRISSLSIRWQYAESLSRRGLADSAAQVRRLLTIPRGLPPAHFALRGFVVGPARAAAGAAAAAGGTVDARR